MKALMFNTNIVKIGVSLFFATLFIIGASLYKDYGMAWDDYAMRDIGGVNIQHIAPQFLPKDLVGLDALHQFQNKDYGPAFEILLVFLESVLNLKHSKDIYEFRHLAVFTVFIMGVLAIFVSAKNIYGDYRWGLLAALMLVLSPRIFAEAFYNTKDIVFMSVIAMAIYGLTALLLKPSFRATIIHGFLTALAVDIRIMGIAIFALTLGALSIFYVQRQYSLKKILAVLSTYIAATIFFVVLMWPFLWSDPWGNFLYAFQNMAKFVRWNGYVLYLGDYIRAESLPWHYVPVWIVTTTPLIYTGLMLTGYVAILRKSISGWSITFSSHQHLIEIIAVLFFTIPIAAVITLGSVLYDGWRQLYFIYPAFILIAVKGAYEIQLVLRKNKLKNYIFTGILIICLSFNGYWMFMAHPLQNVYFNILVGKDWKSKFDLDYWGLGNKQALQYLLKNDSSPLITVKSSSFTPLDNTLKVLDEQEQKRIRVVDDDAIANYILDNYRQISPEAPVNFNQSDYELFYDKKIGEESIISVWKRKHIANQPYSIDVLKNLSISFLGIEKRESHDYAVLEITNLGDKVILASSSIGTPIRISWRYYDNAGQPTSQWDARRKDLPSDLGAFEKVKISIPLDSAKAIKGDVLQVSWVQDGVFWGYEKGVKPLSITFK